MGEDGLKEWMKMFVKTPFAAVASASEREKMLHAAQERLRVSFVPEREVVRRLCPYPHESASQVKCF